MAYKLAQFFSSNRINVDKWNCWPEILFASDKLYSSVYNNIKNLINQLKICKKYEHTSNEYVRNIFKNDSFKDIDTSRLHLSATVGIKKVAGATKML